MDTQSGRAISARFGEQNLYSGIQSAEGWPLGERLGSKGQARPFGRLDGRNQCAGSKGGIRLGRGSGRESPDGIQSAQGWGMGEEPQRGSGWGESILPDGAELAQCQ